MAPDSGSTLIAHCGGQLCTREELKTIPHPESMGPHHKPIPHLDFVETLTGVLTDQHLTINREEFATYKEGLVLFGVMDLVSTNGHDAPPEGCGFSLGFRGGNDQSMARQIGIGQRVFVCDNLCFSADLIALKHKHTTGFKLHIELQAAVKRYIEQTVALTSSIERAQTIELASTQAKEIIFDLFTDKVLPARLFASVADNYFKRSDLPDCAPNTLWGLHNSCTREVKKLKPARRFEATTRLGGLLRMEV